MDYRTLEFSTNSFTKWKELPPSRQNTHLQWYSQKNWVKSTCFCRFLCSPLLRMCWKVGADDRIQGRAVPPCRQAPYLFSGWSLIRIIYGFASIFWQVDWTVLACFLSQDRTQSNGKNFVKGQTFSCAEIYRASVMGKQRNNKWTIEGLEQKRSSKGVSFLWNNCAKWIFTFEQNNMLLIQDSPLTQDVKKQVLAN